MLAAAATVAALAGGTAFAQQTPSDTGTDANGPITILKNMQPQPDGVSVDVDGSQVDDLHSAGYADITGIVHRGKNTLTIRWGGSLQRLDFKVAFAPTRNAFKDVLVVRSDAARDPALRRAGSRTLSFTIPG
ncbi:MAG: hypothetical protein JWO66_2421 [Candidatus Eremiobacteraeota bacterium]|jgi:hypothetical protein|nr:hypothetical protein [Candidatus Eremiobacteraeota bacterium]